MDPKVDAVLRHSIVEKRIARRNQGNSRNSPGTRSSRRFRRSSVVSLRFDHKSKMFVVLLFFRNTFGFVNHSNLSSVRKENFLSATKIDHRTVKKTEKEKQIFESCFFLLGICNKKKRKRTINFRCFIFCTNETNERDCN